MSRQNTFKIDKVDGARHSSFINSSVNHVALLSSFSKCKLNWICDLDSIGPYISIFLSCSQSLLSFNVSPSAPRDTDLFSQIKIPITLHQLVQSRNRKNRPSPTSKHLTQIIPCWLRSSATNVDAYN